MAQRREQKLRPRLPHILILPEDSAGVKIYLRQSFSQSYGDQVTIYVDGNGYQPETLYQQARKALNNGEADMVFLVFDKDRAPKFDETIRRCLEEERIFAFATIPCFEYFFLLHFGPTTAPYSCYAELEGPLRANEPFKNYTKKKNAVPIAALLELQPAAFRNAELTRRSRIETNSLNPYTDLDLLFKYVEIAKRDGIDAILALSHSDFLSLD